MITYFDKNELQTIKSQRKKALTVYLITLAIFLAIVGGIYYWYSTLPYKSPTIFWTKVALYPLAFAYLVFTFIYLGIVYGRVNKFYKVCYNMVYGISETYQGEFLRYSENLEQKDGIDCKSLIFKEWNKYKNSYFERKVMVFYERDFPEIQPNSMVKYVVQANILISYEYLDKNEQQGEEQ